MLIGSPFSVEKYCDWTPNTQSPPTISLSHEDSTNEENDIQAATSVAGGAYTDVNKRNEAINICVVQKGPSRKVLCILGGFHVETTELGSPFVTPKH